MKRTHPTYTGLVTEYLAVRDDFVGFAELLLNVGCNPNQLRAALHSLQQYRAIDCVTTPDGPYWFATPDSDQRTRTTAVIAEHTKRRGRRTPRKPRTTRTEGAPS